MILDRIDRINHTNNKQFNLESNRYYQSSKHSHIFSYKQEYINFIRIGRHLGCAKRQLENSLGMFATFMAPGQKANSDNIGKSF